MKLPELPKLPSLPQFVDSNPILRILVIIVIAIFINELGGYLWHRFAAHWGWAGDTIRRTHYEHHEIWYPHNDMESKKYRIDGLFEGDSWPWLVPAFMLMVFYYYLGYSGSILMSTSWILIVWMVIHIYAISYIHDSYHITDHWLTKYQWYRDNKVLHNIHHYYNCNYGISNYIFDYLLGSLITDYSHGGKQNIFGGFVYDSPKICDRLNKTGH